MYAFDAVSGDQTSFILVPSSSFPVSSSSSSSSFHLRVSLVSSSLSYSSGVGLIGGQENEVARTN